MTWILVFWLSVPENFTAYERFETEEKCQVSARAWNARLQKVNSKLICECRKL